MKRSYFKYILGLLLFGSNGIVASYISLSSSEIVLMRSALGCILLIALFFMTGHKLTVKRHKKDLLFISLSGAAMAADWLLLFEAYVHIGVSLGILINYCGPVIVMALSPVVFKERIIKGKLFSLFLALLGLFLISIQSISAGVSIWGLLCAVLSAVSYSGMVIFNKKSEKVTGMENAVLQLFFAFITISVFVFCKKGLHIDFVKADILPVLILGFINTGIGCYFYFSSIGALPAQTVAVCGYLEPLSAVLFSAFLLKENMLPVQIAGAMFIIGGAILGELSPKRKG